jgi:hypothetical protein
MAIPDLDIRDEIDRRFAEEKKIKDEAEAAAQQKADHESWQTKRKATQDGFGMTEEAMVDLEKWMVEHNVGDYDVAASYRVQKNPKVSGTEFSNGKWDHEKQAGFADIAKDPEGWGKNEILKAIYQDQDRSRGR